MDVLLGLEMKGLPNSEYVFLNVDTGVYLYHQDEALLNTQTTDSGYLEIIDQVKASGNTQASTYSYQDEDGVTHLVVYKYLKNRNWIFMVRNNAEEVYKAVTTVRIVVGMLCAIVEAVIVLVTLLILHRQGKELMILEHAIRRLGNLELSADQELTRFHGRKDEIGMIAQTTHNLCDCLRKTIEDIGRILGGMAEGNIAVDVTKNASYDLRVKSTTVSTVNCDSKGNALISFPFTGMGKLNTIFLIQQLLSGFSG